MCNIALGAKKKKEKDMVRFACFLFTGARTACSDITGFPLHFPRVPTVTYTPSPPPPRLTSLTISQDRPPRLEHGISKSQRKARTIVKT